MHKGNLKKQKMHVIIQIDDWNQIYG
jgi:hypothetical protein